MQNMWYQRPDLIHVRLLEWWKCQVLVALQCNSKMEVLIILFHFEGLRMCFYNRSVNVNTNLKVICSCPLLLNLFENVLQNLYYFHTMYIDLFEVQLFPAHIYAVAIRVSLMPALMNLHNVLLNNGYDLSPHYQLQQMMQWK